MKCKNCGEEIERHEWPAPTGYLWLHVKQNHIACELFAEPVSAPTTPESVIVKDAFQGDGPFVVNLRDGVPVVSPDETGKLDPTDIIKTIVADIRAHCTLDYELVLKGGDAVIYAVADWIDNPPEWIKSAWANQSRAAYEGKQNL